MNTNETSCQNVEIMELSGWFVLALFADGDLLDSIEV